MGTNAGREGIAEVAARLVAAWPTGLTTTELCSMLRRERLDFAMVTPNQIERLLARRPEFIVREADGRWLTPQGVARRTIASALDEPTGDRPAAKPLAAWVIFDMEATTPDPATAELLQIAAVRLDANLHEVARFDERLAHLAGPVPPEITRLTGIRTEDVTAADPPSAILADFCTFARGARLVAHNGSAYDGPLLARLVVQHGVATPDEAAALTRDLVDSLAAACILFPRAPTRTIGALCEELGITMSEAHRAGADVDALVAILRSLRSLAVSLPEELRALLAAILSGGTDEGTATATSVATLLGLRGSGPVEAQKRLLTLVPTVPAPTRYSSTGSPPADSTDAVDAVFATGGPLARAAGSDYEARPGHR